MRGDIVGFLSMLGWLRALPFYAWPWAWQMTAWSMLAISLTWSIHAWRVAAAEFVVLPDVDAEPMLLARIADAERQLVVLPALQASVDALPQTPIAGGKHLSTVILLAWLEQRVFDAGLTLLAFEPAPPPDVDERFDEVDGGESIASATPAVSAVRFKIEGDYIALYRWIDELARTEPPLLLDNVDIQANGERLTLTARIEASESGLLRIGTVVDRDGGDDHERVNPFARRHLPEPTSAARLLGVLREAGRCAALMVIGEQIVLLETGHRIGDARILAIGSDFVTLEPFAGGPVRKVLLRDEA